MNEITASNLPAATATNIVKQKVTPGWQTSEFWMTAAGHVGLILAASTGALPSRYAAIAAALSQVAYNLSRGLTKSNPAL